MTVQSSPSRFSIGVPVSANRERRPEAARRTALGSAGVLDLLRLVEDDATPVDPAQCLAIAGDERVRREDEVDVARRRSRARSRPSLSRAVVDVNAEAGREPRRFPLPVADQRHRADEQRRTEPLRRRHVLLLGDEKREQLDGLAQPHIVGEDPAEPEPVEVRKPADAALLVPAELGSEARWSRDG